MFHRRKTFRKKRIFRKKHAVRGKKRMTFAKKVLKVVRKAEQKKITSTTEFDVPMTPYGGAGYSVLQFPVCLNASTLNLVQGTGDGDRVGNKVKVHKMELKACVYPSRYDATYNVQPRPMDVRVIIGRNKELPQSSLPVSTMYETGDSYTAPNGSLYDVMAPINKSAITVYKDRVMKVGTAAYGGTAYTADAQGYFNNDYKFNQRFTWDLTKYVPSHGEWNDTVSTPIHAYTFCAIVVAAADGSNYIPTTGGATDYITYTLTCTYTDI